MMSEAVELDYAEIQVWETSAEAAEAWASTRAPPTWNGWAAFGGQLFRTIPKDHTQLPRIAGQFAVAEFANNLSQRAIATVHGED